MSSTFPRLSLALLLSLAGCAATPPPRLVRVADLGKQGPLAKGQALVIELEAGDVIPLHFSLDGPFVQSPADAPPIPLRVTRHFYLRIDGDGLKSSVDGQHFDGKPVSPGHFQVGVGAGASGIEARIAISRRWPALVASSTITG